MFLRVENLSFSYQVEGRRTPVLKNVSFGIERGDFVGIQGRSGSGKSTLFYVLGCLLRPDEGHVYFEGTDLTRLGPDELAFVRNRKIGFIFQQFHLLPKATVLDNILLPTLYPCEIATPTASDREKAIRLATRLGLQDRLEQMPNQLSGGEQQRVAIARALMGDADIILADEPTGNLDSRNAENIMTALKELNAQGKTVILITHDGEVAKQCKTVLHVRDGQLFSSALGNVPSSLPPGLPDIPRARYGMNAAGRYLKLARSVVPLALENLTRNKTRAFLTMVGVTVGIAAVFSMLTFGQFAKTKILHGYEDLGANTVSIWGSPNDQLKASDNVDVVFRSFNWEKDILPLKHIFPQIKYLSPLLGAWGNTANFGGLSIQNDITVMGVTAEYLAIANRKVTEGRAMTPYHVENRSQVCLIGADIKAKLFRSISPIGQMLFITHSEGTPYPCRIIGVLAPQSSSHDWRKPNLDLLLPYTYHQSVNSYSEAEIRGFTAQLVSGADTERVGKAMRNYLRQKYGLAAQIDIDSDSVLLAQMKKFLGLFAIMLAAIALITLSVGGMGINNMMLVSIAERLKEIGLRKAVGATDRSIRIQFLLESTFLSILAGILGVLLGFSAYETIIYIASKFVSKLDFEWVIEPRALILSLLSIVLVGIGSGIIPALKAQRLNVIEALRTE